MKRIKCNCHVFAITSPDCNKYGHNINCDTNTEKKEFARLKFDGAWCIMELDDAFDELRENENGDEYTFQKVWMTQNKFDALPEFMGW